MTSTQYTISEAARITGKSRTTLRGYLKKGRLSYVEGHGEQRLIDAAELMRVFGNDLDFDSATPKGKRPKTGQPGPSGQLANDDQAVRTEAAMLREQLDREISERRRERERMERDMEELHGVLKRAQDGHQKAMLLLESRTQHANDWEKPLRDLKTQIAQQRKEQQDLKESAKRRISKLQEQLQEERAKGFWKRLLG